MQLCLCLSVCLSASLSLSLSLPVLTTICPGEDRLAGFIGVKVVEVVVTIEAMSYRAPIKASVTHHRHEQRRKTKIIIIIN